MTVANLKKFGLQTGLRNRKRILEEESDKLLSMLPRKIHGCIPVSIKIKLHLLCGSGRKDKGLLRNANKPSTNSFRLPKSW